jgi:hypothetical protein
MGKHRKLPIYPVPKDSGAQICIPVYGLPAMSFRVQFIIFDSEK